MAEAAQLRQLNFQFVGPLAPLAIVQQITDPV